MTDYIKMAREAGFEQLDPDAEDWVCFRSEIEAFAKAVRAAALEEAAVEFEGLNAIKGDAIAKCLRNMKETP